MRLFEFRFCTGHVRCHTILVVARDAEEACAILKGNADVQSYLDEPDVELHPVEKPLTGIVSWTSLRG